MCSSEGKQRKEARTNAGDRNKPKLKVILDSELGSSIVFFLFAYILLGGGQTLGEKKTSMN